MACRTRRVVPRDVRACDGVMADVGWPDAAVWCGATGCGGMGAARPPSPDPGRFAPWYAAASAGVVHVRCSFAWWCRGMACGKPTGWGGLSLTCWCGGVLLSHILSGAVPSPCQVLASGFGMGPGVSPGPWPPQVFNSSLSPRVAGVVVRGPDGGRVRVFVSRCRVFAQVFRVDACLVCVPIGRVSRSCCWFRPWCRCWSCSTVSAGRLHRSRGFHVRSIDHMFSCGVSRHLGGGQESLSWSGLPA